jgi:hypothetical protein
MATTVLFAMLAAAAAGANGVTYRFETGARSGTVWAAGRAARMESTRAKTDAADEDRRVQVEIWKDGGRQVLVVDDSARTFYDRAAREAKGEGAAPPYAVPAATVSKPFEIVSAKMRSVDVRPAAEAGADCRPVKIAFSYDLELRISGITGATFPASVTGVDEACLATGLPVDALPFGHGPGLTTGISAVDDALARAYATVPGVPVRRTVSVTRRIEGGEPVTSTLSLSGLAAADVPAARLDVPAGYQHREPVLVGPMRQR